jgi:ferrous iron transport protein A
MVLAEVKKSGVYHIKSVHALGDVHRHLEDMGLLPGESIKVISTFGGNIVLSVKGSRVALSRELAKSVII